MKLRRILAVLMLSALLLSGCAEEMTPSGGSLTEPIQTEEAGEAVEQLLTRDYIIGYLWYSDGFTAAEGGMEEEYLPVSPEDDYNSLEELEALLKNTYTAETAERYLQMKDRIGRPRFIEREGKLYKSAYPVVSTYLWDYSPEEAELLETDEQEVRFAVAVTNLLREEDPPLRLELTAFREDGAWHLSDNVVELAERSVLPAETAAPREQAERFLRALSEPDPALLAETTGEPDGLYDEWQALKISASLTETLEEYEGYGRYRAAVTVEEGLDVFPEGSETYLLVVSSEGGLPAVSYFEPESDPAYPYLPEDPAVELTKIFLQREGYQRFRDVVWLDDDTATDYLMAVLSYENPGKMTFSEEELKQAAERLLGLKDFLPSRGERVFANGAYYLPGGAQSLGSHLIRAPKMEENGKHTVLVERFTDRLHKLGNDRYLFTFGENADGSLHLISIT